MHIQAFGYAIRISLIAYENQFRTDKAIQYKQSYI